MADKNVVIGFESLTDDEFKRLIVEECERRCASELSIDGMHPIEIIGIDQYIKLRKAGYIIVKKEHINYTE